MFAALVAVHLIESVFNASCVGQQRRVRRTAVVFRRSSSSSPVVFVITFIFVFVTSSDTSRRSRELCLSVESRVRREPRKRVVGRSAKSARSRCIARITPATKPPRSTRVVGRSRWRRSSRKNGKSARVYTQPGTLLPLLTNVRAEEPVVSVLAYPCLAYSVLAYSRSRRALRPSLSLGRSTDTGRHFRLTPALRLPVSICPLRPGRFPVWSQVKRRAFSRVVAVKTDAPRPRASNNSTRVRHVVASFVARHRIRARGE